MLFINPFLLLHLSISNPLDISSIHKARKFCIFTSFTTQWKQFIYLILFFSSVHHWKFLSCKNVFLPMQSEILLHKTRTCSYPCGGDCIGSEVKFRFFCGWLIVKLLFRMILPSLARRLAKGTAGGLTDRQGPFSLVWRRNWRDHCLHSTALRVRGCLSQLQWRMEWAWQSVHEGSLSPTPLSFTTSPKNVIEKLMSFEWLI